MTKKRTLPLVLIVLAVAAIGLAACGGSATPISVYVTPTAPPATPDVRGAAAQNAPASGETVLIDQGITAPVAVAQEPTATATQYIITPRPTIVTPAGANYGPIVGSDYTPGPLASPLPTIDAPQACPAIVQAAQVNLYANPDLNSEITASATMANKLIVNLLFTDAGGGTWANTDQGWLPLNVGGTLYAQLDSVRTCDIMTGAEVNKTLLGLHMVNWTSEDEVYAFVQKLHDAGIPLGTLKGLSGTEQILTHVKAISPETVTVYRSITTETGGQAECPKGFDSQSDPVAAAQEWYSELDPKWDMVNADYYEYMNECTMKLSWLAGFSIEMMRQAAVDGRCLLLFSFPGGNPSMDEFDELLPAYQYAVDNPCQPGRTHGISMHAYSDVELKYISVTDVWLAFRHRIFYDRLLQTLPAAANLPIYITEAGEGSGTQFHLMTCEDLTRDMIQYTNLLESDPYVKGFHLFNIGEQWPWADYTSCLPQLADALIAYYQNK
ncbi:MAG TPA: hypothetical protein PKD09_16825 [Aggregatilinea sp.]|uniref:hypothetical protein n=1 Tax=Aggregatilinea sp. TaxID=2806333 RepID=UPI002B5CBC21|nr:hypothetical protein [Aggregatilinea sp.]HML23321.1 hypothetical protein [Aggregatilinea sp.]